MKAFIPYSQVLANKKAKLRILILGSYKKRVFNGDEESCEEKLITLKKELISRGFLNTKIVKDFMDEDDIPSDATREIWDTHFEQKSFYHIKNWADVLLFIFFDGTNNLSVGRELAFLIHECKHMCKNSIILWHKDVDLGLYRGDMSIECIFDDSFEKDDELPRAAYAACFKRMYAVESDS